MTTVRQMARYGLVGLVSNAVLYVGYLMLTKLGTGHKTAMTLVFVCGVSISFLLNRGWTFSHRGNKRMAYARYWAAYAVAYVVNLSLLALFVDVLGYEHQIVQGVLVLVIAAMLFVALKLWVFRPSTEDSALGQVARR